MNLKFMLDFCHYAFSCNAEYGWSMNDIKLVIDLVRVLEQYQHITSVSQLFIDWREEMEYYAEQYELANSMLLLREEQTKG